MAPEIKDQEVVQENGGAVVFATDVIATIAGIAAAEVEGVESMSGNLADGISGMLGKKSLTKGIKVEVNDKDTTVDVAIVAKYGFRIQDVCRNIQENIKKAIENMTGLNVIAVNVAVQAVSFEKPETAEPSEPAQTTEE